METLTTAKVLRWGNSYGIRLSKHDFERAGLVVGSEVAIQLVTQEDTIDVPFFTFRSGHADTSADHDEVLYGRHRTVHGDAPDAEDD